MQAPRLKFYRRNFTVGRVTTIARILQAASENGQEPASVCRHGVGPQYPASVFVTAEHIIVIVRPGTTRPEF